MNISGISPIPLYVAIVLGLVTCLFGYRLFRLVLVLVGALFGFSIGVALVVGSVDLTAFGGENGLLALLAGLFGAILGGVLGYVLYPIATILAGALLGATIGATLAASLNPDQLVVILLIVIGAILGGLVALPLGRIMIMLSTAFSGAALAVGSFFTATQTGLTTTTPNTFTFNWVGLVAVIVLAVIGFVVQYRTNPRDEILD